MNFNTLTTKQKALKINLERSIYGSFAEIGAGQEVARQFFRAGAAAGTIAKTMSAYDMIVSDTIYGKEKKGRYVSEERLHKMLDREYNLLIERLAAPRSEERRYFAFADTVAAKSYGSKRLCHGWLGLRFQDRPRAQSSDIILHVKLFDNENIRQQEVLGVLGVNLLYACYFAHEDGPESFVQSLMDELSTDRVEIATIKVRGPNFVGMDARLLSLELVKKNFTPGIMFDSDGSVLEPADALYKKNILLLRGSFRPPTHVNMDMLECGLRAFKKTLAAEERQNIVVVSEMSMSKLLERGEVDNEDFLARVDLLLALQQKVMISNNENFYRANEFLHSLSQKKIAFVLGIYNLVEIFDQEKHEKGHAGGLLGALGALFGLGTRVFVYPSKEDGMEKMEIPLSIHTLELPPNLYKLRDYLVENKILQDIQDFNPDYFGIWSREVLAMIQKGDKNWEGMVPSTVVEQVKSKNLFGFAGTNAVDGRN